MNAKTNAPAEGKPAAKSKGKGKDAKMTQSPPAAPAPVALYKVSNPFKVRESSARGYAQAQLRALASAHPNGFTLAQYREALVSNLAGIQGYQPKGGWEKHNMPTWSLGSGWIAPVTKAS